MAGTMDNARHAGSDRRSRGRRGSQLIAAVGAMIVIATWLSLTSVAVPVSITVPLSSTSVTDTDLDGDPATGSWADALLVEVPLENGEAPPYGTASLYAKHDGSNLYLRIDGSIDVAWISAAGDHFWLGMQISATQTSHHGGGEWDGTFFGLWNGAEYAPTPTYPPRGIDTHGFDRPPLIDELQDVFGTLRYSGSAPPYSFTAEWRRSLGSGDVEDLGYVADGATPYNFFITTDSNGGGSGGGVISHRQMTNLNVLKLEASGAAPIPPTITHNPPQEIVVGETTRISARVVDEDGVAEVRLNYTTLAGAVHNETMVLVSSTYVFSVPPQNESGTLAYFIWAVDSVGAETRSASYNVTVAILLETPSSVSVAPTDDGCLRMTWGASNDPEVIGYRLYRWNATTTSMEQLATLLGGQTDHTDCDVEPDRVYVYWIVSVDAAETESPPSVLVTGRATAPSGPVQADRTIAAAVGLGISGGAGLVAFIVILVLRRPRPPGGPPESS